MNAESIGVIGGGTMGLTLAWRLAQAGKRVVVLEAAPRVGGLATWFDYGDFSWDKFYHVIPRSDSHLIELFEDLGISDRLRFERTLTGFLWNNRFYSVSSNFELLKFPALSLWQKMRMAAGVLYCRMLRDPSRLEGVTAEAWMRRVFGASAYDNFWAPIIESKYGSLKGETPAMIMWATLNRYASTRQASSGAETMGFLSGGLKTFYDSIVKAIEANGGTVRTGQPVRSIRENESGVAVQTEDQTHRFERVVSSLPTALLKRIAGETDGLWDDTGPGPRFLGVVCMALVLEKPINPYYVTNLVQRGFPFTGIIGVSNLTGGEELNGRHLAMLPRYDVPESDWFDKSDDAIAGEFLDALRPIVPDLDQSLHRWFVHREKRVQALWTQPPPENGPRKTPSGRIWSVNAELAGRDTLNNNAIVRVANQAAESILAY